VLFTSPPTIVGLKSRKVVLDWNTGAPACTAKARTGHKTMEEINTPIDNFMVEYTSAANAIQTLSLSFQSNHYKTICRS
jgi:hypothetical protein